MAKAELYFEANITVDFVLCHHQAQALAIAKKHNFQVDNDSFTSQSKQLHELHRCTDDCIQDLKEAGFQVRRYRIKELIVDSSICDQWRMLT